MKLGPAPAQVYRVAKPFETLEFQNGNRIRHCKFMRFQASFESQVESANPPTVTELARQGTKHKADVPDMLGADNSTISII